MEQDEFNALMRIWIETHNDHFDDIIRKWIKDNHDFILEISKKIMFYFLQK